MENLSKNKDLPVFESFKIFRFFVFKERGGLIFKKEKDKKKKKPLSKHGNKHKTLHLAPETILLLENRDQSKTSKDD